MVRKQSGQTPKRTVGEEVHVPRTTPSVFLEYPRGQHRPQGATDSTLSTLQPRTSLDPILSWRISFPTCPRLMGCCPNGCFWYALSGLEEHQATYMLTDISRSPWSQQQTASKPTAPTHTPPSSTTPELLTVDPPPTLSPPGHSAPGPSSRRLSVGMPPTTSRRRRLTNWPRGLLALP